jgi:hypothetical protein
VKTTALHKATYVHLALPLGTLNSKQLCKILRGDIKTLNIDGACIGDKSNGDLLGIGSAGASLKDPLDDSRVLAKAGPDEST